MSIRRIGKHLLHHHWWQRRYFPRKVLAAIEAAIKAGEATHSGQVRFVVEGALDSCAGILFNVKPNGDYLTVRFNGKEDNLVLWTFNKGVRKFVKKGAE